MSYGLSAALHVISEQQRAMSNLPHARAKLWCIGGALTPTFHIAPHGHLLSSLTWSLYGGKYTLKGALGGLVTVDLNVSESKITRLIC